MTKFQDQLQNVNVASSELLATPEEVKRRLPLTTRAAETVFKSREIVRAILERRDPRLFVVVGPCSIHDVVAAREYAVRLKGLAAQVESTLLPIMRVYFEKPRTTESQTHREMASGLSTPVGFKNGTDGSLATSINALQSVRHPHHFLGITQQGQSAVFRTRGNAHAHLVLRGGGGRVNYDAVSIALAERELAAAELPAAVVVDCSHGNSNKDPSLQPQVAENCIAQIVDGNRSIVGLMLESHLKGGKQTIPKDLGTLEYGMSITDPCIDWQTTESLLLKAHRSLQGVRR